MCRSGKHYSFTLVEQSVGHLTRKSGVLGSIPGLATYLFFSFRFFKKDNFQLWEYGVQRKLRHSGSLFFKLRHSGSLFSIMGVWCAEKTPSLWITVRHHSASFMMPISDPRYRLFYPHRTPMKDTYILAHQIRISACFTCTYKSYLIHVISPRTG